MYSIRGGAFDTCCTLRCFWHMLHPNGIQACTKVLLLLFIYFWNKTLVHACIPFGEVLLTHFARNLVQIDHDHLLHALPPTHKTQNVKNYQIKEPYVSAKEPKRLHKSPNIRERAQISAKELQTSAKQSKCWKSLNPTSPPCARSAACKALLW